MSKDFYIKAEEILEVELGRVPTWEEIEEKAIDMISSIADGYYEENPNIKDLGNRFRDDS